MTLSLLTTRDTESNLNFTLSFTVSYGLPSRLTCVNVNNNVPLFYPPFISRSPLFTLLSREVIRSHYVNSSYPDMTRVSITLTGQQREAKLYKCTVFVEGRVNVAPSDYSYDYRQMGNAASTVSITG